MAENRITHVMKRSGRLVLFDERKIIGAIMKAMEAIEEGTREGAETAAELVTQKLNEDFPEGHPTVEDVQDRVEHALIELQQVKVAKAYILYRHERQQLREQKQLLTGGKVDELDIPLHGLRVLEQRYLQRNDKGEVIETPSDLFWRVASKVAQAEHKHGGDIKAAARSFFRMMANQEFLPSSPILMNAGTPRVLSSCFVLPIEDNLESIFKTLADAALIQKNGGGTGFAFSRLRPRNDMVAGVHNVTGGPIQFMRLYEAGMRSVKQAGRRQGANMAVLRVDHPDILDFINLKLDGQSLSNFNLSVGITDAFMKALENNEEYTLMNPRTQQPAGMLSARAVFDTILTSSWRVGDPGLLFIDRINKASPCRHIGTIESTNPCAEQPLLPYESCNEGSINLLSCVKRKRSGTEFDFEKLARITRDAVWFLDNTIEVNNYILPEIERMAKGTRKIGIGIMGWADVLYDMRIPYDGDLAVSFAKRVAAAIHAAADSMSCELGETRGVFGFYKGSEHEKRSKRRRNSTVLGIAPTGTISMIADTSAGIEPNFALAYTRTLADGRELLMVNPVFDAYVKEQELDEEVVRKIVQRGYILPEDAVAEEVRKIFVTALQILPDAHIRMQAAFQEQVDSAISKTINFPVNATIRDIEEGYMLAWKLGCKGITVYRDNSLNVQVLNMGNGNQYGGNQ